MRHFHYEGKTLREARFPLGGIGAGSVSIDGGARLVDWEIMNRQNKESYNGFSHLAVKAEQGGKLLSARVLNGPLPSPYMGKGIHPFGGYTYGPARETMAGVPHFSDVQLTGRFPVAEYGFAGDFPGKVRLTALSPFEPGNDFDSSLPLAMFEVAIENDTDAPIDYSIAFTVANPDLKAPVNLLPEPGVLLLTNGRGRGPEQEYTADFGEVCVATDAKDISSQQHWFRGNWFDSLNVFWQDFARPGRLPQRSLEHREAGSDAGGRAKEHGVLCAHISAAPGETATVRFALSWYYPYYEHYWGEAPQKGSVWCNWYATEFTGAQQVARYGLTNWNRLRGAADAFVDAMYTATLPEEVIDAAVSTLAVLKSPTCLRLADGSFWAWEGSHARDGSCEGSCQHVWNYQYALPMLFPGLERSMRTLEFTYSLKPDGGMPFRLRLPLGAPPSWFRPCADGQLGTLIKTYREWKLSGDTGWLRGLWPSVKKALSYTWSKDNPDLWDPDKSGVLTGRQHHTLDMELFGPNSWLTGMYLAALEASARMADAMGEPDFAAECRAIKEKGMRAVEETLFNGEYYQQTVDLCDKAVVSRFGAESSYWNEEGGEIKYQIAGGCSVDQLLGQWHSDLCGLGDLLNPARVQTALKALYKHNFKARLGDVFNPCRLYGLEDEAGLLICSYPEGAYRPKISVPYAEETMHGFEYAAACHMILRGLEEEGLSVVRAVRSRYDGERRNPWNEIECGGNYARSMAAWALVPAYQGLSVDLTEGAVSFSPLHPEKPHKSLWAFGGAWGTVEIGGGAFTMKVLGGKLSLRSLALPTLPIGWTVRKDGAAVPHETAGSKAIFAGEITLMPGEALHS